MMKIFLFLAAFLSTQSVFAWDVTEEYFDGLVKDGVATEVTDQTTSTSDQNSKTGLSIELMSDVGANWIHFNRTSEGKSDFVLNLVTIGGDAGVALGTFKIGVDAHVQLFEDLDLGAYAEKKFDIHTLLIKGFVLRGRYYRLVDAWEKGANMVGGSVGVYDRGGNTASIGFSKDVTGNRTEAFIVLKGLMRKIYKK